MGLTSTLDYYTDEEPVEHSMPGLRAGCDAQPGGLSTLKKHLSNPDMG
jgi:hypothetical protein